jgi:hypothetical protein
MVESEREQDNVDAAKMPNPRMIEFFMMEDFSSDEDSIEADYEIDGTRDVEDADDGL